MSRQTNVAGAAVLAGLIAGGSVYASGHRVSDPGLTASADARTTLMRVHPTAARHLHLMRWHPVKPPKHIRPQPAPATAPSAPAAPAVTAVAAASVPVVAASAPTTHTSPAASGDDGTEGGDD